MDRLQMPSAMPAELAESLSDVGRDEPEIDEAEVLAEANRQITDADWWNEVLEGICPVTNAVPATLARCMQNLDAACAGDAIAMNAITSALHALQKQAREYAYESEIGRHA